LPNLPTVDQIQNRLVHDRRLTAAIVGIFLGASAVILGIVLSIGGPILAFGLVIGIAIGLYVLTDMMAALYVTIAAVILVPFGTLPVKIGLIPSFIDIALGGFLLVYLFQWMTGKRSGFKIVPANGLIIVFVIFTLFSFVAGLAHASPTSTVLRKFAELILAIILPIVIVDVARDEATLRRITLAILVVGTAQALIGLGLYILNDATAERLLNALSRFGYPLGGVIRYVNDDPLLAERAIGTWIDPNAYGGFLMMIAAVAGVQSLSLKPVVGKRRIAAIMFGLIVLPLWLTQSRGAVIALAALLTFVAALRYRWVLIMMVVVGSIIILLPTTQAYIDRFVEGLTGQDISTQMRFGEIKDALILIGRYPVIGVGFAGAPDRDIYLGVSMLYLKIAGGTGIIGLALFLLIMAEVFRYGLSRWSRLSANPTLLSLWLGFAAGIIGALVSGIFDHYYFNIEFHAAAMMFWTYIGLSLAAARQVTDQDKAAAVNY
jgi:polysaccharide biosynthesis protein PslJ